jgi:hypothetical protein
MLPPETKPVKFAVFCRESGSVNRFVAMSRPWSQMVWEGVTPIVMFIVPMVSAVVKVHGFAAVRPNSTA